MAEPEQTFTPIEQLRIGQRLARFGGMLSATHAQVELLLRVRPDAREQAIPRYKDAVTRRLLDIFGMTVLPPLPRPDRARFRDQPYLVVANHRTAFDIGVLMAYFGGVMLSRGDLRDWPVIGPLARTGGTIFVDRSDGHSGANAIRQIRRTLKQGQTVSLYPEGTTYIGDDVRPFQPGAFAAARGLDIEIIPVGLAYDPGVEYFQETFMSHLMRVAARPRTHVAITVGEPFSAKGKTKELASRAHESVSALVEEARGIWSTHTDDIRGARR